MSAVCPACGVAVVPGYVRCPKCQAALPARGRRSSGPAYGGGGTAVAKRGVLTPLMIVGIGIAILAIVAVPWVIRQFEDYRTKAGAMTPEAGIEATEPAVPAIATARPTTPVAPATTAPAGPDPRAAAAELERQLKRQRLWATVEVIGDSIDVRSGSCDDPEMAPMVDAAREALRAAGLTRMRCLAQSGRVVFERDI